MHVSGSQNPCWHCSQQDLQMLPTQINPSPQASGPPHSTDCPQLSVAKPRCLPMHAFPSLTQTHCPF